jgi:hypothetical protein
MNSKRFLILAAAFAAVWGLLLWWHSSSVSVSHVATTYVKVNGYTNAIFSRSFERTMRARPGVLRLESVPVVNAASGITNKNAAGVRLLAVASSRESACIAAADAAALLCSNVYYLYGFSAVEIPSSEATHQYSLVQDSLRPKAIRLIRSLY